MYPGMMHWWRNAQRHGGCGDWAEEGYGRGHGRHGRHGHHEHHGEEEGWSASHDGHDVGGGAFGIRRPLRFLAYRLELDEPQVAEFAKILDELKVERAQAEVDRRRTVAAFADALEGESFNGARATEGGDLRVQSAEKLRGAVQKALGRMHTVLRPEQRQQLAYLIRTGALMI